MDVASWVRMKARDIHSQEMLRISIDSMIEKAIRETIEECARRAADTDVVEAPIGDTYYAQLGDAKETRKACVAAILAMLEEGG